MSVDGRAIALNVAQDFAWLAQNRLPLTVLYEDTFSPSFGLTVAAWYYQQVERAQSPAVGQWMDLAEHVHRQYVTLTGFGLRHEVVDYDPIASPEELWAEVESGSLRTWATPPGGHPVWTQRQNDEFRFVHDVIGHAAYRLPFSREGEDMAYRVHRATMPEYLWPALATETRGQNSALNFGPEVAGTDGHTFAEQLAIPAPIWVAQP